MQSSPTIGRGARIVAASLLLSLCWTGAPALAAFIPQPQQTAAPPAGFAGLCARHGWACGDGSLSALPAQEALRLADQVNRAVNAAIAEVSDRVNYGMDEFWTLPVNGAGDCEDYSLLKKRQLMQAGLPEGNLLLAVAATPRMPEAHVVLVLRTDDGDYVLDNLRRDVRAWRRTGYTIMKLQRSGSKRHWDLVMAGPRGRV